MPFFRILECGNACSFLYLQRPCGAMTIKTDVRVIYGDTDAMGQAYHGNYLQWFEIGRSEWFRHAGLTYKELEEKGVFLPVVEAHCLYRRPAFYDDLLTVSTTVQFAGALRLRFDYEISRDGEILTTGYTIHVCVSRDRKVLKPPAYLKALIEGGNRVSPDAST